MKLPNPWGGGTHEQAKFVALAWAAVSLAGVTAAIATPPSGAINRNDLAVGKVTDPIDIKRREPSDFHIQVSDPRARRQHRLAHPPRAGVLVIKAGELVTRAGPDCEPPLSTAGQGVFIPAGTAPHGPQ